MLKEKSKQYSKQWLPDNFVFDKFNPLHLHLVEKNINNILTFVFENKYKITYNIYPYPTHKERELNVIYLTKNIRNIDFQLGSMLYRVGRKLIDFDINDLYNKCLILIKQQVNVIQDEDYYKDKILLLIHNLLIHNTIFYINSKTPGLIKYVRAYIRTKLNSHESWKNNKIISRVFINENWNTYLSELLLFHKLNFNKVIITKLIKILYKEYQTINTNLSSQEIINYVVKWFILLENNIKQENDYSSIIDDLDTIEKYFNLIKKVIFNNLDVETITPKLYYQKQSIKQSNLTQIKYKYNNNNINILQLDLNKQIAQSNLFNLFEDNDYIRKYTIKYIIPNGILIGKKILNYLKYRDNISENKLHYQKHGILNRKLLYRYVLGDEHIYYNEINNNLEKKTVYLTVDASKSMSNEKWDKLQTFVISLIYAISNINSLDIKVTYRMTTINKNKKIKDFRVKPVLLNVFNSNDNFNNKKTLFSYLKTSGGSPEGILIDKLNVKPNSILINVSDGKPEFYDYDIYYTGEEAINHTKKIINKLKQKKVKLLSFFIGDNSDYNITKRIYGQKNSIDVTNINDIDKIGLKLNNILFT